MGNIIRFFTKYGIYFWFLLLEVFALILVVNNNSFQKSVFLTSCNKFTSSIYEKNQAITEYFYLGVVNEELAEENVKLKNQLIAAQNKLRGIENDSTRLQHYRIDPEREYIVYPAKVINNSTNKLRNYITLNRGSIDGIRPEMSVISNKGVVGIVKTVSRNYAVVLPVLNPKSNISCKLKARTSKNDTVGLIKEIGSLNWDGKDSRFAQMVQVPRHVKLNVGDTIVTSGYSKYFPEGILVGTVEDFTNASDNNYYNINVRLSVNFRTISYVKVMKGLNKEEQEKLEAKLLHESNN